MLLIQPYKEQKFYYEIHFSFSSHLLFDACQVDQRSEYERRVIAKYKMRRVIDLHARSNSVASQNDTNRYHKYAETSCNLYIHHAISKE